jgi:cytoskeleton protein RodZ
MNEHEHQARPQDAQEPLEAAAAADTPAAIGDRLRAARQALGLARDEFARKAHMPTAVLADLEEGRFERLGAAVYVRGYLRSAARAAGIPEADLAPARVAEPAAAPLQVAPRPAPMAPRWLTRYATPVAYALLTAVVMVPLVYLARPNAQQLAQVPSLTPIDSSATALIASAPFAPPVSAAQDERRSPAPEGTPAPTSDEPAAVVAQVDAGPATDAPAVEPQPELRSPPQPVMASLAPMPAATDTVRGAQRVTLRLRDASWVEFTGSDGRRLEYALLPAGTLREYRLTGRAELRVGNSTGAELSIDGQQVPLPVPAGSSVARVVLDANVSAPTAD